MDVLPVGRRAVLLACADAAHARLLHDEVRRRIDAGTLTAPDDLVPAACTVLVDGVDDPFGWARPLLDWHSPGPADSSAGTEVDVPVEVPVVYDGPDLAFVARRGGIDPGAVGRRHAGLEHTVAFCGFSPGFAYVAGLPDELEVPRHTTPRERVPAGSVALADAWTGVYPSASPGGWQLIGRTDVLLFDPERDPPGLLTPGARVRFVPVEQLASRPEVRAPAPAPAVDTGRSLTVVRAGLLTTVQDRGRAGHAALAVPRSGALDAPAAARANRLVGNALDAAVLETTAAGCSVQINRDAWLAVSGAPATLTVAGRPVAMESPLRVHAGEHVDIGAPTGGLRCYLAVDGGLAVAPVLGSRSTDVLSGLGPATLVDGQRLPLGEPHAPAPVDIAPVAPIPADELVLHLDPGPRLSWLSAAARRRLVTDRWEVSPASNRIGLRLTGPELERDGAHPGELASEGTVVGAVQVPADGQPLVFLADHPTTVGYPVVAVVAPADLPRCAQLRPGAAVRFAWSVGGGSSRRLLTT